ncbi:alpha/beta hydrolase [Flavobacteriaceae bacterium]|jgi:acetyl esterase/lipase|nr:alpha/beta hydrolase [Flavobacteriaceae bacterium]MDA7724819.1 alpha/beta hydrolase [Flavobacteriaceae bacterium]MDA7728028.1 alpha/beta hydrolase [Flavobacteriaceae bacterium]MDA7849322.1 alpha/beta hydrolase [Flavobacteriaceae bacterium]
MKRIKKLLFASLFLGLYFGCSKDSPEEQTTTTEPEVVDAYEALNVSYGSDANQVFDIYLPENRTNTTKILILIHGGSWVSGDKSDMNTIKTFVSALHPDVGIINMNYTLAGVNNPPVPLQTDDISAVVDYISTNKSSLIVSDDIGFIGVSAGAHLSLLWSYAYDDNDQVDMVCSIVGPANFTDPAYYDNLIYQPIYQLFGNPSIEFLESASPYHRATTTSPPTLLFYGGMDPLVPTSQGVDMDAQLTSLGVTHEFHFYPDEGHGWEGDNLIDTTSKISTYIEAYIETE